LRFKEQETHLTLHEHDDDDDDHDVILEKNFGSKIELSSGHYKGK
jgi:hypothetical protein